MDKERMDCCYNANQMEFHHNLMLQEAQSFHLIEEVYQQKQKEFSAVREEVIRKLKDIGVSFLAHDGELGRARLAFVSTMTSYWEQAETCVMQEVSQTHMLSQSTPSAHLRTVLQSTKESVRSLSQALCGKESLDTRHAECDLRFSKMLNEIIPKITRLFEGDTILRNISFFTRITPFLQYQYNLVTSFTDNWPEPAPPSLPSSHSTKLAEDSPFFEVCNVISGDFLSSLEGYSTVDPTPVVTEATQLESESKHLIPVEFTNPMNYQSFMIQSSQAVQKIIEEIEVNDTSRMTNLSNSTAHSYLNLWRKKVLASASQQYGHNMTRGHPQYPYPNPYLDQFPNPFNSDTLPDTDYLNPAWSTVPQASYYRSSDSNRVGYNDGDQFESLSAQKSHDETSVSFVRRKLYRPRGRGSRGKRSRGACKKLRGHASDVLMPIKMPSLKANLFMPLN